MKTDGIIFDMDGTLWDTCQVVADSWTNAVKDCGIDKDFSVALIRSCMGMMMEDFVEKCMPEIDRQTRMACAGKCFEYENSYLAKHGGVLFPRVIETLSKLQEKYPLFIVSNCQAGYIEAFFEGHKTAGFFKDYENPGRTGLAKAENIRLICERNKLQAPVYVGDTAGDLEACQKAGVPFIYAAYGFGEVSGGYCAKLDNFEALIHLFL